MDQVILKAFFGITYCEFDNNLTAVLHAITQCIVSYNQSPTIRHFIYCQHFISTMSTQSS